MQNMPGRSFNFSYSGPDFIDNKSCFVLEFDKTGKCSKTIETQTTDFVFCDFGIYRGMLFIEPNQTIKLQLPPVREKSFAEQKNPYFEPVSFWFATENKQQLNNQISDFTSQLNQLTDKYFDQLYFRQSRSIFDSLVYFLDKKSGTIKNESFVNHKMLSLKMIETEVFRLKPEDYSAMFSNVKQQFWLHPAFTELFNKTFNGQLSFEVKSVKGDEIRKAVNQGNISFLADFTKAKYKVANDILDLVLLKMLHDAYYSGDFNKSSILQMVKSTRFTNHKNQIIREAANNISAKITFLQPESSAPAICLKSLEGENICTNQNNKKYKYLIFADTEMVICREHLKYLPAIQQKFQKNLEIFIVLRKTDASQMKKFFTETEVPGIKLIDENNEFIDAYKVRSFPQCYLLDENHKVKFAAAKAPLDGFEQQFGAFIQQELFNDREIKGNSFGSLSLPPDFKIHT
ncbi:MAG: redoxin domain-containing protein [Draconibacterium sp.]|nr:redoxin domain-containing protein [Draconibacterium sp.]